MAKKVVTFGEIMLRLQPDNYLRFVQVDHLEATFGGGEANVLFLLQTTDLIQFMLQSFLHMRLDRQLLTLLESTALTHPRSQEVVTE